MFDATMEAAAAKQTAWTLEDDLGSLPRDAFGIPHVIYLLSQLVGR